MNYTVAAICTLVCGIFTMAVIGAVLILLSGAY